MRKFPVCVDDRIIAVDQGRGFQLLQAKRDHTKEQTRIGLPRHEIFTRLYIKKVGITIRRGYDELRTGNAGAVGGSWSPRDSIQALQLEEGCRILMVDRVAHEGRFSTMAGRERTTVKEATPKVIHVWVALEFDGSRVRAQRNSHIPTCIMNSGSCTTRWKCRVARRSNFHRRFCPRSVGDPWMSIAEV